MKERIFAFTTEMLAKYIGGQLEIQNQGARVLHRGTIKKIYVRDRDIHVELEWSAVGDFPGVPKKWIKDPNPGNLKHVIYIDLGIAINIGPSSVFGGDDMICFKTPLVGETSVIFPPNGQKLDPKKVEGLQLAEVG
jgi:hypothetical protein